MRIAFCGAMCSPNISIQDLETQTGQIKVGLNTGNFVIGEYGRRTIQYEEFLECKLPWRIPMAVEEFNEKFDHLVIFATNWLAHYMNHDFTHTTEWLEKIRIPISLIGLGAQYELNNLNQKEYISTLNPSLLKMFRVIASKNNNISVRGFVTQDLLHQAGINNVKVTGCPSWFKNGTRQAYITKKAYSPNLKIAMHADPSRRKAYPRLYNISKIFSDKSYILQSEFDLIPLMRKDNANLTKLCREYCLSEQVFHKKNWGYIFGSLSEWENYISTRDIVIGLRIHGTIISLKNGVPAILFYHDGRTLEFVDVLGLPKWGIDDLFDENKTFQYFYEHTDFSDMNKKYHFLLSNYKLFLQNNGLKFNDGTGNI